MFTFRTMFSVKFYLCLGQGWGLRIRLRFRAGRQAELVYSLSVNFGDYYERDWYDSKADEERMTVCTSFPLVL